MVTAGLNAEEATASRRRARGGSHPLASFILRRIGIGLVLLIIVSGLVFASTQVLPGDAASAILGRAATADAKALLRHQLGLDRPLLAQYWSWASGVTHGSFGYTLASHERVSSYISARIWNTAILAGCAIVLMLPISLVLGVWAGIRRDRAVDHFISGVSLGAIALPEFVIGTLLVALLAVHWTLLPAISSVPTSGNALSAPSILVMPVATLLVVTLAYAIRMVRAGVADAMASEYVQMARLNGIAERRVIWRHALRNALAPAVQVFALTVQWLVGGTVVVETVFNYPGIGQGLVSAVTARDIPTVQAIVMLIAAFYIVINIVADVIVVMLIPKLRTSL